MTATEQVILVDLNDNPVGIAEKIHAHQHNLCHRAFSVFILKMVETTPQVLLQQRANSKYHSAGLWTNTCCSHPRPNEDTLVAAKRRLMEEMNIDTPLESLGWFHYIAHFENGLVENEIDHVLIGFANENQIIHPNPAEVQNYRWISISELKKELAKHPKQFTPWLSEALQMVEKHFATPAL